MKPEVDVQSFKKCGICKILNAKILKRIFYCLNTMMTGDLASGKEDQEIVYLVLKMIIFRVLMSEIQIF